MVIRNQILVPMKRPESSDFFISELSVDIQTACHFWSNFTAFLCTEVVTVHLISFQINMEVICKEVGK